MRRSILATLTAMLLLDAAQAALAEDLRGVALVIGESDYDSDKLRDLPNPKNDARAMTELLDRLGFKVRVATNDNRDDLNDDIQRFLRDAKTAEVALVYYSGHGIEAGGADYLVPSDADLSTPQTAGASLVPVQDLLDKLAKTVPLTITLLDACRTNAFPSGTVIQLPGTNQTIDVAATGLGEMRGPVPAARPDVAPDSLGMVLGFAAAPGQPALDGEAGGNSPYAAALLKHLGAGGYSFGDVMTMVSEEVYLKTDARQLPWTNSSLRRVLSFGAAPAAGDPDEAAIAEGRRKLLLSIAALDPGKRGSVEAVAKSQKVPLGQLYGMLSLLDVDTSLGPDDLEAQLEDGAKRLKKVLSTTSEAIATDAEAVRLTKLADEAQAEGAIDLAQGYRIKASARADELERSSAAAQAQGHLANAAIFAKDGDTALLAFDYARAVEMYGKAFDTADYWDKSQGNSYKWSQANALSFQGDFGGDSKALAAGIDAYHAAITTSETLGDTFATASLHSDLGKALQKLGQRQSGTDTLEAAVAADLAALAGLSPADSSDNWANAQNNLGNALGVLGSRESGTERLQGAVTAYRAALGQWTREGAPLDWAVAQTNLANVLRMLGERENSSDDLHAAVVASRAALEEWTPDRRPLEWAAAQNNLGNALQLLGIRGSNVEQLRAAAAAYRAALTERTQKRVPLDWASTQGNLGSALRALAELEGGTASLSEAIVAYRAALTEQKQDRVPLDWAMTQNNLGNALERLGELEPGTASLRAAVVAYRAALEERTRERVPLDWAMTQSNLGVALVAIGRRDADKESLVAGVTAQRAALEEQTRERTPLDWAAGQNNLGVALQTLGERETGTESLAAAVAAYRAALEEWTRERAPLDWALAEANLGWTLAQLGQRTGDRGMVSEGRAAIQAARGVYQAAGQSHDDYFAEQIARIDAMMQAPGR